MTKFPHLQQQDEKDCGAACLAMVSSFYGHKIGIARTRSLIKTDGQGANIYGIIEGAKQLGFECDALEGDLDELFDGIKNAEISFPFIARIITGEGFEHFIVVYGIKNDKFIIGDPGEIRIIKLDKRDFARQWLSQIITFSPAESFERKDETKGLLKKFFRYVLKQKKYLILVAVLSMIVAVINFSGSAVFNYIAEFINTLDTGYEDDCGNWVCDILNALNVNDHRLDAVCLAVLFLYALRVFFSICRSFLLALLSKYISIPLVSDFYNHLVDLPMEFYSTRKSGELLSRLQNTNDVQNAISSAVLTVMLDSVMAVFFAVLLYNIDTTLFFITFAAMCMYAAIIYVFKKPIKRVEHEIMERDAKTMSYFNETMHGYEFIKSANYNNRAKTKFGDLFRQQCDKQLKGSMIGRVQWSLVNFVGTASTVILLWVGAYFCIYGDIEFGALLSFYYMIDYFIEPISNLIDLQPTLQTAVVAAERLNDVFETMPETIGDDKPINIDNIEIRDISFRYGYRENVLNNVSINIKKGQKIALVGESGCGKTTIAKLLMDFYEPLEGGIYINNEPMPAYSKAGIRHSIAYISQNVFLLSDTVRNNLRAGNDSISDAEIENICKLCKADEFINHLPMGYDTVLDESGSNLSGGQRQRLAIARALLRKPQVLIMDEATSNLDTVTETAIQQVIDSLSADMTCVIIAHRLRTIRSCDYIYVMQNGSVTEQGTHDELINEQGVYYQLCQNN